MAVDRERVAELYRSERARIRRSLSRVAAPHRTEDVLHDAFLTFLTNGDGVDRPSAWLTTVARNRALNDHRRPRSVELTDAAADDPDPGHAMERRAIQAVVVEALGELDERSRRALTLRFYEERDYATIASDLGLTPQQTHVVMHRAARRLGRAIVRRLAAGHDAIECAAALERMAGIAATDGEHAPDPCRRCQPAWDEIAALRLPALVPVGLVVWMRRLVGGVASRVPAEPAVSAVALTLATAMVVLGPVPPQPEGPAAEIAPATSLRVADTTERNSPPPGGRSVPATRSDPVPRAPDDAQPPSVVEVPAGARITEDGDHTQADAGGGTPVQAGVVLCDPLEPCPD